jgi:hypothetical protein
MNNLINKVSLTPSNSDTTSSCFSADLASQSDGFTQDSAVMPSNPPIHGSSQMPLLSPVPSTFSPPTPQPLLDQIQEQIKALMSFKDSMKDKLPVIENKVNSLESKLSTFQTNIESNFTELLNLIKTLVPAPISQTKTPDQSPHLSVSTSPGPSRPESTIENPTVTFATADLPIRRSYSDVLKTASAARAEVLQKLIKAKRVRTIARTPPTTPRFNAEDQNQVRVFYVYGLPFSKLSEVRTDFKKLSIYVKDVVNLRWIGRSCLEVLVLSSYSDVFLTKIKQCEGLLRVAPKFDPRTTKECLENPEFQREVDVKFASSIVKTVSKTQSIAVKNFFQDFIKESSKTIQDEFNKQLSKLETYDEPHPSVQSSLSVVHKTRNSNDSSDQDSNDIMDDDTGHWADEVDENIANVISAPCTQDIQADFITQTNQ